MTKFGAPKMILLLVKSEGQFKHSGKYALISGRWRKLHKDKPIPKGVPVAAHPHSAGAPVQGKPFSDDEWKQVVSAFKLENIPDPKNAKTVGNKLEKLKNLAESGDITGILGMQFGTNSYEKHKVVPLANYILDQLGSSHKVSMGQLAGTHAAVQTAPQIEAGQPAKEGVSEFSVADADEILSPGFGSHSSQKNSTVEQAAIDDLKFIAKQAKGDPVVQKHNGQKLVVRKDGNIVAAVSYHVGSSPIGSALVVDTIASLAPGEGKKLLSGLMDQAKSQGLPVHLQATGGASKFYDGLGFNLNQNPDTDGPGLKWMTWGEDPAPAQSAKPAEEGPKDGDTKQGANGQQLEFKDGRWHKVVAADEHGELPPVLVPVDDQPAASGLTMPSFDGGTIGQSVIDYYEKVGQKIIDMAAAGDVAGLEAMKAKGLEPNSKGKVGNTWKGKTPNSKALIAMHAQALEHAKGGNGTLTNEGTKDEALQAAVDHLKEDAQQPGMPAGEAAEDKALVQKLEAAQGDQNPIKNEDAAPATVSEQPAAAEPAPIKKEPRLVIPKKAREAAPAPVEAKQATNKLDQIPWDAQLLPDTNKNSKSNNKQVGKIKALAYAGDIAGLEAFKAGSNTYGKAQNKLAQTALAALKEGGAQAAGAAAAQAPSLADTFAAMAKKEQYTQIETMAKEQIFANPAGKADVIAALDAAGLKGLAKMVDKETPVAAAPKSLAGKPAYDHLAHELKNGGFADTAAKDWMAANPGAWDEMNEALTSHGYEHLATFGPAVAGFDTGPKEGDTKQGADGMLVLKDGHWVKVEKEAPAKPQAATSTQPATVKKLSASEVIQLGKVFKTSAGNKAKIKAFAVAGDMEGLKQFIATVGPKMPASKKLAEIVLAAMEAAPEVPVGKPKASKPKPAPQATAQPAGGMESMDAWQQTGPQGGSNPGGRFKDADGVEWYCKFPADEDTAKAEVLAAKLYAALGISGQDAKLVTKGGKVGIASKWTSVSKAPSPAALAKTDGVASGFGADAWLGNWDVVGLGYDNLQIGADGKAHRVDAGGSLMYRAQGGKKAFGNVVSEIDSLRDPKINPQAAAVFGGLTQADITASVAKVLAVSDFTIATLVHKYGPGSAADKQNLIETLVARKADLAAKFPAAAKKKTPKFKPEEISAPPDFMNWGGSGKSGPSSKPFLNDANHKAAQNIFDAAKSGDPKAVQVLTAPIYNKDTGEITGSAPVLEHPSQHIKGYAQQVINEINYQLNPPKKFRFDGGHPLHALNAAYPAYKGALQSQTVSKVAKFINLGEPGQLTLDSLGLEKKTYQSGKLTQQTYSKQAQSAIAKMPLTQKQAVKAYTGSSYHSINSSLWSGNPSGQADAAAQALHTLGHDIEPGTVLSRKIHLSGTDLNQLLNSKGKVLQEPAIMSTSIRPSCWSGNVHLKLHVGPGVKGLWAGNGSMPGGGALSNHSGEDEIILPPNTRLMIIGVKSGGSGDADGFGASSSHVVEAVILPSEGY